MAIKREIRVICDRCGRSIEVDSQFEDVWSLIEAANRAGESGWSRASGDRVTCPGCSEAYRLLTERHAKEIEDFFTRH